jgi:hypothetical protein
LSFSAKEVMILLRRAIKAQERLNTVLGGLVLVLEWDGQLGRHLAEQAKRFARLEDTDTSQLNTINAELKAFISDWANFQTAERFAKSALEKAMSDVPRLKWQAATLTARFQRLAAKVRCSPSSSIRRPRTAQ